jgi:adenosylhomocysteine nucleosidase
MTSGDRRTPAGPCAAAIVFAVDVEADPFARLAADVTTIESAGPTIHEGVVAGRRVAWCVGGVGADRARRAARLLVAGHRPGVLVTAGFAGGLDPAVPRGAVVHPGRVVDARGGDEILFATPPGGDAAAPRPTIVTVGDVVATAEDKRRLAAASGAGLVDMESRAVAEVAREAGIPCLAIRVVSDDAATDLPREVATLARPQSAMRRLGTALGAIGRRPGAALDLWRLWEHAVVDGRTLAAEIERVVRALSVPA